MFLPQRLPGQRCVVAAKLIQRPGGNIPSAVDTRSGAQVIDVVCHSHGVFIMFHHDERVAPLLEPFESSKQMNIVARMQPDGGLIQDVKHP